jgi:zinc transport system ATP-binding protein
MTQENLLIQLKDISFSLKGQDILKDINLEVSRGEIVTIIGPNGAGKTTLFRSILGLIKPTSGSLWKTPNLKIGYMPQKLHIEQTLPLTVRRFLSLKDKTSQTELIQALASVRASTLIDRSLHVLSGGEMQRVLLARALIGKPDLLVLDEPVQGVDINGQQELYQFIGDLRIELNCGILLVSHDLHLVLASSDQVICLNQHVCCAGQPAKVILDPEYTALFGTRAAEHLALYTHHHDHVHDSSADRNPLDKGHTHG